MALEIWGNVRRNLDIPGLKGISKVRIWIWKVRLKYNKQNCILSVDIGIKEH